MPKPSQYEEAPQPDQICEIEGVHSLVQVQILDEARLIEGP